MTYIHNGQANDTQRPVTLHWGRVTALYDNGALRNIAAGGHIVLSQIYAAVRDGNWGTIHGILSDVVIDQQADSCHLSFTSTHWQGDVDFVWHGDITGGADGTLAFGFRGEARSTFWRNRIGFCVLHPMDAAGAACRVEHFDGRVSESRFPESISPHQPFFDIRAVTHQITPDFSVETRMDGDTFEMEDQRQWTDASFKTYCTPLALTFPVRVETGTVIEQRITVIPHGKIAQAAPVDAAPLTINIGTAHKPLPNIGLCVNSDGHNLTAREIERLRVLNPAHLCVDLRLNSGSWRDVLANATKAAQAIGCGLELAVHVTDAAADELAALREALGSSGWLVARVLVFHSSEKSTDAQWVTLARKTLGLKAPVGGGTDAFFTELNRQRPQADVFDVVAFSSNPQVHAFDDLSLIETLAVLPVAVATAERFCGGKPISVTPITFKMRFNPNATGEAPPVPQGELPPQVDPRQMSLFGAAWTLGSLKTLASSSVRAVTYYETVGWRGVMEHESGAALPDKFPSIAGGVYPMYHIFADIGSFSGESVTCVSSDPLKVEALVLAHGNHLRVMLANFTPDEQKVVLRGLAAKTFSARRLDAGTADFAMRDPEGFRMQIGGMLDARDGELQLTLPPYGLITLDGAK